MTRNITNGAIPTGAPAPIKLIRLADVQALTGGMSKSAVYAAVSAGLLPRGLKAGGTRRACWVLAEVTAAIQGWISARDAGVAQ